MIYTYILPYPEHQNNDVMLRYIHYTMVINPQHGKMVHTHVHIGSSCFLFLSYLQSITHHVVAGLYAGAYLSHHILVTCTISLPKCTNAMNFTYDVAQVMNDPLVFALWAVPMQSVAQQHYM